MEKIALNLIYLTSFLGSLLCSTAYVCFFCNVHTTMKNLAYFNPHNPHLACEQLHRTFSPWLPPLCPLHGLNDGVNIHWRSRLIEISIKPSLFLSFFSFLYSSIFYFLLHVKLGFHAGNKYTTSFLWHIGFLIW